MWQIRSRFPLQLIFAVCSPPHRTLPYPIAGKLYSRDLDFPVMTVFCYRVRIRQAGDHGPQRTSASQPLAFRAC